MTSNVTATQVFDKYLAGLNNKVRQYYVLVTTFAPSVSSQALLERFSDEDFWVQICVLLIKYRSVLINGGDIIYVNMTYVDVINRLISTYSHRITDDDGTIDSDLIDILITLEAKHKK